MVSVEEVAIGRWRVGEDDGEGPVGRWGFGMVEGVRPGPRDRGRKSCKREPVSVGGGEKVSRFGTKRKFRVESTVGGDSISKRSRERDS